MKQTVHREDFRKAFLDTRPNQFSYEALDALFNYFESIEGDTGEEMDLDVIAICCDFVEYDSLADFHKNGHAEKDYPVIESLEEVTTVIQLEGGGFVMQNF